MKIISLAEKGSKIEQIWESWFSSGPELKIQMMKKS